MLSLRVLPFVFPSTSCLIPPSSSFHLILSPALVLSPASAFTYVTYSPHSSPLPPTVPEREMSQRKIFLVLLFISTVSLLLHHGGHLNWWVIETRLTYMQTCSHYIPCIPPISPYGANNKKISWVRLSFPFKDKLMKGMDYYNRQVRRFWVLTHCQVGSRDQL